MKDNWEVDTLKAISNGDSKAFELLYLHYQPKLLYFINGFIKDMEVSRDIAHDIFLSIWKNRSNLNQVNYFGSYLFKMGKNAVCNYFDHSMVDKKYTKEQLTNPLEVENLEENFFAKELQSLIDITVSQMPAQRKLIYTMSRVQGFKNSEIAEKLGINKRTVENHLTAALADLRKVIKMIILLFFI